MVANSILRLCWHITVKRNSDHKTDNLSPQMTSLSIVIPEVCPNIYGLDSKNCKFWTLEITVIVLKWRACFNNAVMDRNADGIPNSVEPDQTAPLGAVRSGLALFAQICLSQFYKIL